MYLLDTDILSNLMKRSPSSALVAKVTRVPPEQQFTWLSGAPYGENGRDDAAVRDGGYGLVFTNTKTQRLPSI